MLWANRSAGDAEVALIDELAGRELREDRTRSSEGEAVEEDGDACDPGPDQ